MALLVIIGIILALLPESQKSFDIKDRCGPIMNLISHTIQSEAVCETRCKSQCKTLDLTYSKVNFVEAEVGCHKCTCFCKEPFFS